jgi:uncharacterized membrane protein YkvA (DUF1232 family)
MAKLLGRLLADPAVSRADKAILTATAAYLASPIDLIPDFLPVVGELDDLYLVAFVLLRLINRAGSEKVRAYWDGPEDIVRLCETTTRMVTTILPAKVRVAIEAAVRGRDLRSLIEDGPSLPVDPSTEA